MQSTSVNRCRSGNQPAYLQEGLSSKKTTLIVLIVVGCIAILWPKVFHPMMFGAPTITSHSKEPPRSFGGCCGVVLNREEFYNATLKESSSSLMTETFGPQMYRKGFSTYNTDEIISIRQERPAHLYPDSVYQAMRERGRAILPSNTLTTPNKIPPTTSRRVIDGKRGPIPGMRPPMGGGAMIQPQTKTSSMGFIMPLYTIGIVLFFGYTMMKIAFKKPISNAQFGAKTTDTNFRKEVFGSETAETSNHTGSALGTSLDNQNDSKANDAKLYQATNLSASTERHDDLLTYKDMGKDEETHHYSLQSSSSNLTSSKAEHNQQMEIESLRRKLEETERAMAKLIAELSSDKYKAKQSSISNGTNESAKKSTTDNTLKEDNLQERTMAVLEMEVSASCENGQKWSNYPPTPILSSNHEHIRNADENPLKPKSIYLEGTLGPEAQILISDADIKQEQLNTSDSKESTTEPATILSSKMTLSLINFNLENIVEETTNN